jgi:RNA polymerase sigma-70 factor (ECF subfamily)
MPEGEKVSTPAQLLTWVMAVAQKRDREAFGHLFDHYAPRLNGYLQRQGMSVAHAEEIIQDVMVTLWSKATMFDESKSSVTTWLYRIARNRYIDAMRRDRVDFVDPQDNELMNQEQDSLDLEAYVDAQQRELAVRKALAVLSNEQREMVKLAFFEGLSHGDIVERTGLPLGTVKSRLRLAFSRLRRELEREGINEVE